MELEGVWVPPKLPEVQRVLGQRHMIDIHNSSSSSIFKFI
jgi:hypothetical protein